MALRGAFVLQALFMALNNFTFFVFWWALMHRVPSLRGWHLTDIQLLYGIVAAAYGLTVTFAGGVRYLGQLIDDGGLDTLLTQPKPVLVYAVGMRSQASGLGDLFSGLIFIAWSGQVSWWGVPTLAAVIVASALVFLASGIVFFSLAFWLGKVDTIARQLWELLITFSLYPEPLFGGMLRLVLFTGAASGIRRLPTGAHRSRAFRGERGATRGGCCAVPGCGRAIVQSRAAAICIREPVQHGRINSCSRGPIYSWWTRLANRCRSSSLPLPRPEDTVCMICVAQPRSLLPSPGSRCTAQL
jgi:ABC-2 type transport system permease protein